MGFFPLMFQWCQCHVQSKLLRLQKSQSCKSTSSNCNWLILIWSYGQLLWKIPSRMNKVESSTVDCLMFIYIIRCYHGGKVDTLMNTVRLHLESREICIILLCIVYTYIYIMYICMDVFITNMYCLYIYIYIKYYRLQVSVNHSYFLQKKHATEVNCFFPIRFLTWSKPPGGGETTWRIIPGLASS